MHPRIEGEWLGTIGPYGAFGDLSWTTVWASGASGMFEASWTMPLPADFTHRVLHRGARVELMGKGGRKGSSLVISQIERGNLGQPWKITCEGVGRLAMGQSSFYAFDGSLASTTNPTTAVTQAIARGAGLPWAGVDATVPNIAIGTAGDPQTVGALLTSIAEQNNNHWGVWDNDRVGYRNEPTAPTWLLAPNVAAELGTADDDYSTVTFVRYTNSVGGANATVSSTPTDDEDVTGRQEYLVNLTNTAGYPSMTTVMAQAYADGIAAQTRRRLGVTNRLTLTSNELLTIGGNPAVLSMVEAGQMVRGKVDFVIGEARYTDGAQTIDIAPAGLAARDRAAIIESITGMAASGR